jgi:hypothetical protein
MDFSTKKVRSQVFSVPELKTLKAYRDNEAKVPCILKSLKPIGNYMYHLL